MRRSRRYCRFSGISQKHESQGAIHQAEMILSDTSANLCFLCRLSALRPLYGRPTAAGTRVRWFRARATATVPRDCNPRVRASGLQHTVPAARRRTHLHAALPCRITMRCTNVMSRVCRDARAVQVNSLLSETSETPLRVTDHRVTRVHHI